MIGTGSMGSMLSLLFAEHGIHTHFYDPSKQNVENLQSYARETGHTDKITYHGDHNSLCEALGAAGAPKVFMFSIPHGTAADASIEADLHVPALSASLEYYYKYTGSTSLPTSFVMRSGYCACPHFHAIIILTLCRCRGGGTRLLWRAQLRSQDGRAREARKGKPPL